MCKLLELFSHSKYSLKLQKKSQGRGTCGLKENITYGPCLDSASNEPTVINHLWDYEENLNN